MLFAKHIGLDFIQLVMKKHGTLKTRNFGDFMHQCLALQQQANSGFLQTWLHTGGAEQKSTNILITLGTVSTGITLQPMYFRESRGLAARRPEPLHQARSKVKEMPVEAVVTVKELNKPLTFLFTLDFSFIV